MKNLIACLALIFTFNAFSQTPAQLIKTAIDARLAQLAEAEGVIAAEKANEEAPLVGWAGIYTVSLKYIYKDGDVARTNTVGLILYDSDKTAGVNIVTLWDNINLPEPLRPKPPSITPVATEAQIISYIKTTFSAQDPIGIVVSNITADSAKVEAWFPVTVDTIKKREKRSYILYKKDGNIVAEPEKEQEVKATLP